MLYYKILLVVPGSLLELWLTKEENVSNLVTNTLNWPSERGKEWRQKRKKTSWINEWNKTQGQLDGIIRDMINVQEALNRWNLGARKCYCIFSGGLNRNLRVVSKKLQLKCLSPRNPQEIKLLEPLSHKPHGFVWKFGREEKDKIIGRKDQDMAS